MTGRFAKETRPLLLPWGIAGVSAFLMAFRVLIERSDLFPPTGVFWAVHVVSLGLSFVAPFLFLGCLVILTALSFGTEFDQRTSLSFSPAAPSLPPLEQKMWALAALVGSAVLVYAASRRPPMGSSGAGFPTPWRR